MYSVRSRYYVAMKMMQNYEFGRKRGMSSSSGSLGGMWKRMWTLVVPNKLRFFIWKTSRKALAVRHNLEQWRILVVNKCKLCGVSSVVCFGLGHHCKLIWRLKGE